MSNENNAVPHSSESGEELIIELEIPQVSSVRAYVRRHTVHSWAANDCHQFALADFLIQHQRQRANAIQESDDNE